MPEQELEEIKKLPPEIRVIKLKELEEKRKKEIEEAERLISASIEEARQEGVREQIESLMERGEAKLLQSEAEKRIFESLRGKKSEPESDAGTGRKETVKESSRPLEEAVQREQINPEFLGRGAGIYRGIRQRDNLYEAINRTVSSDMYAFRQSVTQEDMDNYYKVAGRLVRPDSIGDSRENYKSTSQKLWEETIGSIGILKNLGYDVRRQF